MRAEDQLIDLTSIDVLESKIAQVLERLSSMQAERSDLLRQVTEWKSRYEETGRQLEEVSRERDTLKRNQRDPEQEELVRTKITALLAKLEAA
jgi:chorismate mutase